MATEIDKTAQLVEAHRQGRFAQKASLQAQGVQLPQHNTGKKAEQKAEKKSAPAKKTAASTSTAKKTAASKSTAKTAAKKSAAKKS